MTRKRASDFDPEVLQLFDKYVHGQLSRRGFLDGATRFAVGGLTAVALLESLSPRFAEAKQVEETDARIKATYVEIPSPQGNGKIRGYLVHPVKAKGKLPTILVVHENRGLNPHIEDIARRLALDSFIAFAPDALFALGGYPGDEDKAGELFGKPDQTKTHEDFVTAAAYLKTLPEGNGKVGVVGFCYGGGIRRTSTTAPSTDSTTTRRRASILRQPSWPGDALSRSSTRICAKHKATEIPNRVANI